MNWVWFAIGAALSWGLYGPMLHKGQVALGNPMRALLCVGVAYLLVAILIPGGTLVSQGQLNNFNSAGTIAATVAGVLGAFGAIFVIWAFRAGGVPNYVMPIVFGFAPLVNVLYTMYSHPPKIAPNPLLYAGFLMTALGAGMVLYFKPQGIVHPGPPEPPRRSRRPRWPAPDGGIDAPDCAAVSDDRIASSRGTCATVTSWLTVRHLDRGGHRPTCFGVPECALSIELASAGLQFLRQVECPVNYRGHPIGAYRYDFLVEGSALVEIKSVERFERIFLAQVLTYLRATGCRLGLIINFNVPVLKEGIKRVVL